MSLKNKIETFAGTLHDEQNKLTQLIDDVQEMSIKNSERELLLLFLKELHTRKAEDLREFMTSFMEMQAGSDSADDLFDEDDSDFEDDDY